MLRKLEDPENSVFVSTVSTFEIAVKASLKRLSLPESPKTLLPDFFEQAGLAVLSVTAERSLKRCARI